MSHPGHPPHGRRSEPPSPPVRPTFARLRRMLALARPEVPRLALGAFFLAVASGSMLAYPRIVGSILDALKADADVAAVDRAAFLLLAAFSIQAVAVGARYYLFTVAGERIVTNLRIRLYEQVLSQEVAFFDGRRTGELLSRLGSDTGVVQNAVSVNISMLLRNAASVVGSLALLFYTSTRLTLLMLLIVPPVALGSAFFGRFIRRLSRESQDALARAGEVAEETIGGLRTVRAFAQESTEIRRYGAAVESSFALARRRIRGVAWFSGGASFGGYGAIALVVWYGGRLVLSGGLSFGDLTSFVLYTLMLAFSLGSLGSLWADFMRAIGATERVFDLLDRRPQMPLSGGVRLDEVRGDVALESVRFAYPSRPEVHVLDGLSLRLSPGEAVALVGPSGGGKSTIAALLPRFYDPIGGVVQLDGHDVRELDPSWLRQQIGIVAQDPLLLSTSIGENIRYGRPDATDAEVEAAARAANAHTFIAAFPEGYATLVGERGVQLSGGQRQRVAIARAVLKDPRLLILDEATSALDAESEHLVQEALARLMVGRTTLIIAHRLSTVRGADRVIVLDGGKILESGRHDDLMARNDGTYRRLVERQLRVGT